MHEDGSVRQAAQVQAMAPRFNSRKKRSNLPAKKKSHDAQGKRRTDSRSSSTVGLNIVGTSFRVGYNGRKENNVHGIRAHRRIINPATIDSSGDVSTRKTFTENAVACKTLQEKTLVLQTPRERIGHLKATKETPTRPNSSTKDPESVPGKRDFASSLAGSGQKLTINNVHFLQPDNSNRPPWDGAVVPVPDDLLTVTQTDNLLQLQNKMTRKYLDQLRQIQPPSKFFLKDSTGSARSRPRCSLLPSVPNSRGQAAFEGWLRKHCNTSPSKPSLSVKYSSKRRQVYFANRVRQNGSFEATANSKYSLHSLIMNARRSVLSYIQGYNINSRARKHLEKRAGDHKEEIQQRLSKLHVRSKVEAIPGAEAAAAGKKSTLLKTTVTDIMFDLIHAKTGEKKTMRLDMLKSTFRRRSNMSDSVESSSSRRSSSLANNSVDLMPTSEKTFGHRRSSSLLASWGTRTPFGSF